MRETNFHFSSFVVGFFIYFLIALILGHLGIASFWRATSIVGAEDWHQYVFYFVYTVLPFLVGIAGGFHMARKKIRRYTPENQYRDESIPTQTLTDWIFYFLVICTIASGLYISLGKAH